MNKKTFLFIIITTQILLDYYLNSKVFLDYSEKEKRTGLIKIHKKEKKRVEGKYQY